jgi:carbamoyltransferase
LQNRIEVLILGLSSLVKNDATALMRDGQLEAAIEDYKIQPTTAGGIAEAAIECCLAQAGAKWGDIDAVAVANRPFRGWMRRVGSHRRFSPFAPVATIYQQGKELSRLAKEWTSFRILQRRLQGQQKLISLDHHFCHAASAFFLSSFDRAVICTLDGEGDGLCGLLAIGDGNQIRVQDTIPYSDSIGWLYSRLTDLIGFTHEREEHKIQWLGLEGEPVYKDVFLRILRRPGTTIPKLDLSYFRRDLTGGFVPSQQLFRQLDLADGKSEIAAEHKRNIARSLQAAVTEIVVDLLASFRKKFGIEKICLAGGVFQNVLLVSSLEQRFGMGNIFVSPAPGNAGCAVGAASWIWHQEMKKSRGPEVSSVFLGPSFTRQEVKDVLDNVKASYLLHSGDESMLSTAVKLLQAGKIVGWFQGAAEFGPRALGHRSILASPWAPYVSENLNDYVKHRESFRPFAVCICEEDCQEYFEASPQCRFMNSLGIVRPERDVLPPSLQLMGGLIRLHIVEKRTNRLLWELLKRFGEQEQAPILVNTSFNLHDEPSVVRPRDAIRTFFCSGTEAVFIDRFMLTKWSAAYVLNGRATQQKPQRAD